VPDPARIDRPAIVALLTCLLGALTLPETKDNDLTAGKPCLVKSAVGTLAILRGE
jgi:hypothetical protein